MSSGSALESYLDEKHQAQADNPAAPAGAQQLAKAPKGSALQTWLSDNSSPTGGPGGYVGASQGWLTGANTEGTNNGWDNQFVDDFYSSWGQALKDGTARDYFSQPDATGVVTWDHNSIDGTRSYAFGDVYENGQKTGNLYDMYDRDEANLMLAPFVLDAKTQAETFSASDRMDRLNREIESVHEDRNQNFETSLKALEFEGDVTKREEAFKEGFGDEAVVGGAAAGGAGLGAGIGTLVAPGPGTVIGGGVGAVVGGVGGYLNRDSLTEQAARAYEITSMSKDEFGLGAGIATGINQWAGFGMRQISPLSNLSQGLYDWQAGDLGDGESAFYRTDQAGKNKAPLWMKSLDVAATVGDSLLQFSTPIGLAMYTGTMSGTIAGEVGELALTGGNSFDARRGGFDNIFTDEDGKFDASAAAAGIGKVGIDVVQLGMVRGLAGKTNALRASAGEKSAYARLTAGMTDRLPLWMGGRRGLAEGEERVTHAGFSMTRGADGAIVEGSMRPTLGILAPSEQLQALSARLTGLRQAALRKGAYSADDFYHGAHALATGESKIQTMIVNAMGEGYEEGMQAVLEPHSHGGAIDGGDVFQAALYGAAAGVGMGAGMGLRTPSAADQMYAMADLAHFNAFREHLDRKTFDGWSKLEQQQKASLSPAAQEMSRAALLKIEKEQTASRIESVAGYARVNDAVEVAKASELGRATESTDHAFVIAQLEEAPRLDADGNPEFGEIPTEAFAASVRQVMNLLTQHTRGMEIAVQAARDEQKTLDPAEVDRLNQLAKRIADGDLTLAWAKRLADLLEPTVQRIANAPTVPILEAEVADLNETLRMAFHREIVDVAGEQLTDEDRLALARATSLVFVRDPQDQAGSYQMLMPQVSARLTAALSDNVLEISHAVLTPISGDYDGDKIRQQAQLVFDDAEFSRARGGGHFIGAGGTVNIATPKFEPYLVDKMALALKANSSITLRAFARETLNTISTSIRRRYEGVVDPVDLDEVLTKFNEHIEANDPDARDVLINGLAEFASGPINQLGQDRLTNEWLWLDQLIVSTMQRFQEAYASHAPGPEINNSMVEPLKQSKDRRERRALKRATLGQTLAAFAPGDSLFRKFQKLHYSSLGAGVVSAEGLERATLSELAEIYRELSQAVTRTDLEQIQTRDDITGRVFTQLNALGAAFRDNQPGASVYNQQEAMIVMANMQVQDLQIDVETGEMTEGNHVISLAQMLLKFSVMQDRREKARIYESSPELQAKHARLLDMTHTNSRDYPNGAEDAFIEVISAHQMYELLGDQANIFGPHLTPAQFIREYAAGSELERRDTARKMQSDSAYLGRKQTQDMPYKLTEVGQISAYRAMVDAIIKVGNGSVSMDLDTGKLSGEKVRRSKRTSDNIVAIHANAQQALRQFLGLPGNARLSGESEQEAVARMLETRPEVNTALMNIIPTKAVPGAFTRHDGIATPAAWLYEFLTADSAKEAEMVLWRNILYSSWKAMGVNVREEGDDGHHARQYSKLNRRMHRIMYSLAQRNDGGVLYAEFLQRMYNSTDIDEFIRWVNTTPGVRVEGAPIVPWVDDTSEFDADKANGGWTKILEGSELRESIATLAQRTKGMVDQLAEEKISMDNDLRTIAAIRRVRRKDRGEDVRLEAGDRELHDRMVEALRFAENWYVAAGPNAMIRQTLGAVQGMYGKAHNKGVNPENVEPMGALDAMVDALDYTTGYERALGAVTTVNMDAVGANLSHAVKDSGRTMDDYGRVISWDKPTVDEMLDLFDTADTRAMARAMLFPQVMEVDANNKIRPQLLFGKSLTDLLDGVSMKEMFKTNDSLSNDAAMKYSSMIDGRAREFGGHQALGRAANDLVVARTSAADHVLSEAELHRMVVESYRDLAEPLQAIGVIANVNPGMLSEVLDDLRRGLRLQRVLDRFGLDSEQEAEIVIDQFREEKRNETSELVNRLAKKLAETTDPAQRTELEAEIASVEAERQLFDRHLDMLMGNTSVSDVVEMFSMAGSTDQTRAAKNATLEYIRTHLSMIGRVPSVRETLGKLTQQLSDPGMHGQVDLETREWEELSRAVIGVYLDDVLHGTGGGGTISPWPDAKVAQNQKYFDPTFSYLAVDILDLNNPLVKAATEIARANFTDPLTKSQLLELLNRTILNPDKLGPWTSDIVGASVEAHNRLYSAAAAPAIAMAGNAPKRQAVIDAATSRTTQKPDESLLSTVRLSSIDLSREIFDEVDVVLPGVVGPGVKRPLAQLNNRFAKSVTMEYTDADGQPQTLDLMSMSGNPWMRDAGVRESGYQIIHLDRIKRALDRAAGKLNISPAQAIINVEFFHPDSQPEGPEWYNNVYFEGTAFKLDADGYDSLIGALWFSPNGISQTAQRKALDASKTGTPALETVPTATSAMRETLEAGWQSDFAAMLRAKAEHILSIDELGLDAGDFYNSVYKDLKLRHFVRFTPAEGHAELWSAEQVIKWQQQNPGQHLENAKIYVLSDDALRTALGEQGNQGLTRVPDDTVEYDLNLVPAYEGVNDTMRMFLVNTLSSKTPALHETRLRNRARQSQLRVNIRLTPEQESAFDARMRIETEQRNTIFNDRNDLPRWEQGKGFSADRNMQQMVSRAGELIRAEDLTLAWGALGLPYGPRTANSIQASEELLRSQASLMNTGPSGQRSGWIYEEGSTGLPMQGHLNQKSLTEPQRPAFRVAPGDPVLVLLDAFKGDIELAKERLDYMRDQGAAIILSDANARADMRAELAEHLRGNGYEQVFGSKHAYQPIEMGSRYQNPRARLSDLTATRTISRKNRIGLFSVRGKVVQEGGAHVNDRNERLGSIAVQANLIQSEAFAGFNVPATDRQIADVSQKLLGLNNDEGRALLLELARGDEAADAATDKKLNDQLTRLFQRLIDNPGEILPAAGTEFGAGDLIPLVDSTGRILLYRHGMKAPRRDQIDLMSEATFEGDLEPVKVAIYPNKLETVATIHTGTVMRFTPRPGYGLQVELEIPLQMFGDKKQLEWNGMKYVLSPWPTALVLPDHGFFRTMGVDLISDLESLLSKEATTDMVDNHSNAFAFFGIDFLPDVTEFFFPGKGGEVAEQEKTREILHSIAYGADRVSVMQIYSTMRAMNISGSAVELLTNSFADRISGVDSNWSARMRDRQTNEAKIATAMILYLLIPGARVDHVLRTGGLNNEDSDNPENRSRIMPRLFTQIFDDAAIDSDLRVEINRRLNEQIYNPNNDGSGYVLHQDFTFESRPSAQQATTTVSQPSPEEVRDAVARWYTGEQNFTEESGRTMDKVLLDAVATAPVVQGDVFRGDIDRKLEVGDTWEDTPASWSKDVGVAYLYAEGQYGERAVYTLRGDKRGLSLRESMAPGTEWAKEVLAGGQYRVVAIETEHGQYGDYPNYIIEQIKPYGAAVSTPKSNKRLSGYLSFPEVHSSGDNPVKNGMTFDEGGRQGVSTHSAAIARGALGVETPATRGLEKTNAIAKLNDVSMDAADGGLWRTLTDVPSDDVTFKYWHAPTPMEAAARSLNREAMVAFRQEIDKSDSTRWNDVEIRMYNDIATQIVTKLKLQADQTLLVDFWVRQMLGTAAGHDADGNDVGQIFGQSAIAEAKEILWAVQNHYLPVVAGEVPLIHLHDLQAIYRANRDRTDGWYPRNSIDPKAARVTSWDGWTEIALGTALTSDNRFDQLYLNALDGFMNVYQGATRSLMELPVSLNVLKNQQLMDPDLNRMMVSISEDADQLAKNPMLLDSAQATLADVLGGQRIQGKLHARIAPASEIAKKRKAVRRWRKQNGVPVPVDVSMKNFRKNGSEFIDEGTVTNALVRGLIQLRLGTALINPALYVSMGPEQWIRGALDRVANTITGQGTVGITSNILARRGWSRYTPEDLAALRSAYQVLGKRNDFKAMLYGELGFKAPHGPGGRFTRALEAYGRFGTSMQDPTYGMRANTMARRYLEGVLQDILATPTLQVVSPADLARLIKTNPTYIQDHMPDAHRSGLNALAQIRSLKQTTANHFIRGFIDPMAESKNPSVNAMSNLFLKIPLFFSTYATNVGTSILGLQGLDQMTAAFLHGRNKGLIGRIQARMRGDELPENADETFDMADVMEGVDLSRAFIRGGLTHTGLFAMGMWAAGLGLSGEDDEMRRRRLLARAQGVGHIYDPRRIENDFRNADALYLDALPFGLGNLFDADDETGRAMYQMHWVMRQFVSPMIGIEKFFETGDFRHVTWGFEDAMGAFPLVNAMMFDDIVHTAGMLTADADELAQSNNPHDQIESMGLLTRAVGTYERMLFENSFVNQIYIGMDRYDRDPYVMPLRDSDGTLQRDIENNSRRQNIALDTFLDPETHKLRRGYLGRDQASIDRHVLSENRATFAFVSSLFTGGPGDSDYWRYNMPIKTRTFEKAPVSLDDVEAVYMANQGKTKPGVAYDQDAVTVEEVLPEVRNHLYEIGKKQDHFYTDEEIWSAARTAAAAINAQAAKSGTDGSVTALATIEADGSEHPTLAGAKALMLGLYYGSIRFGDAAMQGFYVTKDQRDQIAADWTKELVQEGLELGLDKTRAVSRMKRVMYGPFDNPTIGGLNDIIYAPEEKLSWSKDQTYAQLNTTYVIGPDGRPWATGFERGKLMAALGLDMLDRQVRPENGATMLDSRMNVADMAAGLNTGLRALEPLNDTRNVPTDVEIAKSITDAIKAAAAKSDYKPFDNNTKNGNGGYNGYGGYGHGGGGGGGGGYFSKMYALPNNIAPYGNSVSFINTSNPIIRRADVRRERVWSERGRLNQWQ